MLTYQQAAAIKTAMNDPRRAVPFSRTFFRGGQVSAKTISHKTAHALAKRGLGRVKTGDHKDEGIFVVVEAGVIEYMRHKEKIMSENEETIAEESAAVPAAKKSRATNGKSKPVSSLNLMTHLSEEPRYIDLYPEDVVMNTEGPLFDRRQIEPLDMAVCNSIQEEGCREPPKVRLSPTEEGVYEIVDGRTRLRSGRFINEALGKANLPHKKMRFEIIVCQDDASAARMKHLYNEMRNDRDPLGKCEGMVELLAFGFTQEDVAAMFRVTTKTLQRAKKIVNASDEVKEALRDRKITLVRALELARLPVAKQPDELASYLATLEQVETAANEAGKPSKDGKGGGEEDKPKKKQLKSLPLKKYEGIIKGLKRHQFDDNKARHTDANMAHAVRLALNFVGGGGEKIRAEFESVMEDLGFGITPEEG
jgi:ParB-like chromosome segregation protein Spo0J